jgi:hypothetical protein
MNCDISVVSIKEFPLISPWNFSKLALEYDEEKPYVIANNYEELFTHLGPNQCPITECNLYHEGCLLPLNSKNVLI